MITAKPEFVVFYAWQSDRRGNRNRYFIQEAAADAAAELNADPACPFTIRIDQDTLDVPGLCDIPATILGKIDSADAFLCDLTYIGKSEPDKEPDEESDEDFEPRLCSNPNVLFELGYAFHAMGPERILCVMNEKYGPVAEQIFDLAHRRFPLAYTFPHESMSRKDAKASLSKKLGRAIRDFLRLGRRAEAQEGDRIAQIRRDLEMRVRTGNFHGLVRRTGAITISVIPAATTRIGYEELASQSLPPPRRNGWNLRNRGNSIISLGDHKDELCSIAEMRIDGVILAADTWVLDPAFHPQKDPIVPSSATESVIIGSTMRYLDLLQKLNAPLPWAICISLLEIKNYWFLASNTEVSPRAFPDTDILVEPIVVKTIDRPFDLQNVASLLKPALDFIWREFGFPDCLHYTESGIYNARWL